MPASGFRPVLLNVFVLGLAGLLSLSAGLAQQPGKGSPPGTGKGLGKDENFAADRQTFHFLLENHKAITRTVKKLDNGVETVTVSDRPEVAKRFRNTFRRCTSD